MPVAGLRPRKEDRMPRRVSEVPKGCAPRHMCIDPVGYAKTYVKQNPAPSTKISSPEGYRSVRRSQLITEATNAIISIAQSFSSQELSQSRPSDILFALFRKYSFLEYAHVNQVLKACSYELLFPVLRYFPWDAPFTKLMIRYVGQYALRFNMDEDVREYLCRKGIRRRKQRATRK